MIIRRYVLREVAQAFGAVISVLLLVYVSNRFVRFLAEAAAGQLSADVILELVALKLGENIVLLLPLALYVSVLLALGRLYRDSEVIALTAGGFGITSLARSVLISAFAGAFVAGLLSLVVAPRMSDAAAALNKQARDSTEISGIYPGQFKEYGDGDQVFYVEAVSADRRLLSNVFVQVRTPEKLQILFAKTGRYVTDEASGKRYLVLEDGHRYQGFPGDANYTETKYARHGVLIEDAAGEERAQKLESVPTSELIDSDRPEYRAELQWRISLPISTFLLAMLAVPLARTAPGRGRFAKLFVGVLVYFIYVNVLGVARNALELEAMPSAIGLWPVHLAIGGLVCLLLGVQIRGRWPVPRWLARSALARRVRG
ncbi:MAG: LPS export ABC transporter permease LptF [Gammaproteobacteria bacterium]|nr:LPS export ABC transporter permease LptF [Gammaproteobacteria bacterium]